MMASQEQPPVIAANIEAEAALLGGLMLAPLSRRRRILDAIANPADQKAAIARWLEQREIWGDEAEQLMRDYNLGAGG